MRLEKRRRPGLKLPKMSASVLNADTVPLVLRSQKGQSLRDGEAGHPSILRLRQSVQTPPPHHAHDSRAAVSVEHASKRVSEGGGVPAAGSVRAQDGPARHVRHAYCSLPPLPATCRMTGQSCSTRKRLDYVSREQR